jgi:uncharacterized protein (TIGR02246 family)
LGVSKQPTVPPQDEAAIRVLIAGLFAAWDAGDGEPYGRAFTEKCDRVTFNGERMRSRGEVAEGHQALFDTLLRGSRMIFENLDMRAVDENAIAMHSVGNALLQGQQQPQPSRRSIQTLVAIRGSSEWHFTAFHNTRIFNITPFRAILMKFGI